MVPKEYQRCKRKTNGKFRYVDRRVLSGILGMREEKD